MVDAYPSKNVKVDEIAKAEFDELVARLATGYPHLKVKDYAVAGALIAAGSRSPIEIVAMLVEKYWNERKPVE